MNEGLAAIVAAAFGLVGAAIGGSAAVWGARATAASLLQQVQAQAVAEHGHWRRGTRQDAYEAYIAALHDMHDALLSWHRSATAAPPATAPPAPPDSYTDRRDTLLRAGFRVEVAGPERMDRLATTAHDRLSDLADLLHRDGARWDPASEREWEAAARQCEAAFESFTAGAREVLDAPTTL
ncbi:hypothetical protein ACWF94_13900 [Streptomyces sp. NPDC055078]